MKVSIKSKFFPIIGLALLTLAVETYLIWWVINQFTDLTLKQAIAILIGKFVLAGSNWRLRKAD